MNGWMWHIAACGRWCVDNLVSRCEHTAHTFALDYYTEHHAAMQRTKLDFIIIIIIIICGLCNNYFVNILLSEMIYCTWVFGFQEINRYTATTAMTMSTTAAMLHACILTFHIAF